MMHIEPFTLSGFVHPLITGGIVALFYSAIVLLTTTWLPIQRHPAKILILGRLFRLAFLFIVFYRVAQENQWIIFLLVVFGFVLVRYWVSKNIPAYAELIRVISGIGGRR